MEMEDIIIEKALGWKKYKDTRNYVMLSLLSTVSSSTRHFTNGTNSGVQWYILM